MSLLAQRMLYFTTLWKLFLYPIGHSQHMHQGLWEKPVSYPLRGSRSTLSQDHMRIVNVTIGDSSKVASNHYAIKCGFLRCVQPSS